MKHNTECSRLKALIEKAVNAYNLGGCPFCESQADDYAPYTVGRDDLGQTIACCENCAPSHIKDVLWTDIKTPQDDETQWSLHDRAFFKLHPDRRLHVREPWRQEAKILNSLTTNPVEGPELNAVLIAKIAPGLRLRTLCPFPDIHEADEAGDEAIAARTGRSVEDLLETAKSAARTLRAAGSFVRERQLALAETSPVGFEQLQIHTPATQRQK